LDAHIKNVEASTTDGKYDPAAGLLQVIYLFNDIITLYEELVTMAKF
jgi:hypothetical protein